jgi:predicted amidohydrolase
VQGAELIVVPTANMVDFEMVSRLVVPTRAYENGVFVVYANYCGGDAVFEYAGLSAVAGPDGAEPHLAGTGEGLLTVALSVGSLPPSPYLAERRPELYGG